MIRTMVLDLNLEIIISGKPIIREHDGLAMSSRNRYLSAENRKSARSLSQALKLAQTIILQGEQSVETVRTKIRQMLEEKNKTKVDYISICDPKSFIEQKEISTKILIALAVQVGEARLIDNLIIERN